MHHLAMYLLSQLQIDVTVPVQCLVQDSQLHLAPSSKVRVVLIGHNSSSRRCCQASLLGFYDPCIDEAKVGIMCATGYMLFEAISIAATEDSLHVPRVHA